MFPHAARLCVPLLVLCVLSAGCGIEGSNASTSSSTTSTRVISGKVRGGQQPVTGATIQMYAVGSAGDGSASTPLLSPAATTDQYGNFQITGPYKCLSASSLVYLVATGGNPGLGDSGSNPQIAAMAALGTCGSLNASTYVVVNELTTVAAVSQLAPYMSSSSAIGSGTADAAALSSALNSALTLVNTATGSAPGVNVPSGATVPASKLNTLANVLSACVNSAGGTAGDGSACGDLFSLVTPPGGTAPTDTIGAMLDIAQYPQTNVAPLLALASSLAPFQPQLAQAPADWTFALGGSVTLSPSTMNFALFGPAQTATLTNGSSTSVNLSGISISNGLFTQTNNCGTSLGANRSCTISVTAPAMTAGSAVLEVKDDAPTGMQTVTLSGTPWPGFYSLGDSISACCYPSAPANLYDFRMDADMGFASNTYQAREYGRPGDQGCDVAKAQVFGYTNITPTDNVLFTELISTNDANLKGAGPYEAVFNLCTLAVNSWLGSSSADRFTPDLYTTLPAGWTIDNTSLSHAYYIPYNDPVLQSTTNGAVSTWPIATYGGPIAIWYRIVDGNGGTFTYSVDGGAPVPVNGFTVPVIATQNGTTDSVGVAFVQGVSAGQHQVAITVTSASGAGNLVGIVGVGTSPHTRLFQGPMVYVGGTPYQMNDNNSANTAAYNADIVANVNLLSGMGFGVQFVDIRQYLLGTPAEMHDVLHPNDLGHLHLTQAFEAALQRN